MTHTRTLPELIFALWRGRATSGDKIRKYLNISVKLFLTDIWLMFRVFWSIILNCPVLIKYAFVSLITFTMCPLWNTNHGHDSSSAASPVSTHSCHLLWMFYICIWWFLEKSRNCLSCAEVWCALWCKEHWMLVAEIFLNIWSALIL